MSGRQDYYERLENKKELYNKRMEQAEQNSKSYYESSEKITSAIPLGQPILVDHYSGKKHRRDLDKANNYMNKSIQEDEKADYYQSKLDNIENIKNGNVISSDDPRAKEKLAERLENLEEERKQIKSRDHAPYELTNIGAEIRRTKDRIKELEKLEQYNFEEKNFDKFRAFVNKEINRVEVEFKDRVTKDTFRYMRSIGFLYSKTEKAFVRKFNNNGLYALNRAVEHLKDKKVILEKDEEQEM